MPAARPWLHVGVFCVRPLDGPPAHRPAHPWQSFCWRRANSAARQASASGVELLDQGHATALVHPMQELSRQASTMASACATAAWRLLRGLHHAGQVIHRVQVHIFQSFDLEFDIAQHRRSTMNKGRRRRFLMARSTAPRPIMGDRRAADDGVDFMQTFWQIAQAHHLSHQSAGQLLAALQGAVGNRD